MRLVPDSNVVVSALIARGIPRELFLLGENREVQLFSSERLLLELAVPPERRLDARNVDLVHGQHRLEGPLRGRLVFRHQRIDEDARHDLP